MTKSEEKEFREAEYFPELGIITSKYTIADVRMSCEVLEVTPQYLASPSRLGPISEARCLIAHILMDELKVDAKEISKLFGGRSVTQVEYLAMRGRKKVKADEEMWLKKAVIMRGIND